MTDQTRGMINKDTIAKMKKGVRLINCARGGIINEKDLYDAIKSGKVAGAALDVYEKEPPTDSPLRELDAVVMTPHLGASTHEAQESVGTEIAEQIAEVLAGGTIRNAVNMPSHRRESAGGAAAVPDVRREDGAVAGADRAAPHRAADDRVLRQGGRIGDRPDHAAPC